MKRKIIPVGWFTKGTEDRPATRDHLPRQARDKQIDTWQKTAADWRANSSGNEKKCFGSYRIVTGAALIEAIMPS
jgi:hypothetical protein